MNHTKIIKILLVLFAVVLCFGPVGLAAEPVGTAFTYQGRLIDANEAADGLYDFQFKLFDAVSDGYQLGTDVNTPEVDVIDGYFTVEPDFGGVFDGNERWLEIGVRPGELEDPNAYTALSPRQEITPAPYALYAKNGGGAGGSLWQVNGTSIYYNNGNVGIGTMSPEKKLDIASEGYTDLGICLTNKSQGGTSWDIDNDGGVFKIVEHASCGPEFLNSTRIAVVGNCIGSPYGGNVGIGTESPGAKLEVAGQVKITGGSPASGKVLTSDADGLATWQTPSIGSLPWTSLTEVPAGFADGVDDVGLTSETDPTVADSVKDGVSWAEVSDIPAGFADGIDDVGASDNLGNHTATQNIILNGFWLSGDGGSEGVYVANDGNVGIGTTSPAAKLEVNGNIKTATIYETELSKDWIPVGLSRDWQSVAMSADGMKQTAVEMVYESGGQIYISTDSGITWTAKQPGKWWRSVAMSADGTKQTALDNGYGYGGRIYVSTDSGNTWTDKESNRNWYSVAMSADGTKQTAVAGAGQIYLYNEENTSYIGVGIGTTNPAGKLDVNGSIYQRGVVLHADYVFEPAYKLESIDEHSEFMWQEKHLPAMPKMQKDENGQEIVEIGARSKGIVEELEKAHIYIEQLNKENKELRAKLTTLNSRLDAMEDLMSKPSLQEKGGIK